ncbi:MAG: chromosomal replication initiator protein DnaA [Candidatus Dojkabacteria bacterium]|nr:MAG: chromosomal replication initiator protein DnaA [Candidatus Dojkabacteria bacterium]
MQTKELLNTILENIQTKVSPQVYDAYFASLHIVNIQDESIVLGCKNSFTKQVIETRYFQTLLYSVKKVTDEKIRHIELVVKSTNHTGTKAENLFTTAFNSFQKHTLQDITQKVLSTGLNPKYTFDTFVVGSGNQLAHAAAIAIVDNPGSAYNPFFIYGGVGLGKTHLMQAVGNAILIKNPNAKILYCSTESFLNEMIQSIMKKTSNTFREKYRALDVLLLDDIQFISQKEALQEEFFNTFNTLYQAGKQIILASDRPPSEISHLEERIRSRFEGGLVADIQKPNLETRIAIIQNKLKDRNEFLPEGIIYTIAELVDTNIRELEGALLKISIFAKTNGNVTVTDVRSLLGDKIFAVKKKINPLDIIKIVSEELNIEIKDIRSAKRNYDITYARQISMYLLKDVLKLPLVKIAKHVGRKDHTTVMHGISKIEKLLQSDPNTSRLIQQIKSKL